MNILGVDPGATTGWCLYDTEARRAVSSGQFREHHWDVPFAVLSAANAIVIERPRAYYGSPPAIADCAYVCGRIVERLEIENLQEIERFAVRKALQEAAHGTVKVKNDATAWEALKRIHGGEDCAKKGGALHGVKAHERAALAVAVAFALRNEQPKVLGGTEA